MVKEFEPTLKKYMSNLEDKIDIADLDLIRPKIVLGYSHKTSKLTLVTSYEPFFQYIEVIEKAIKNGLSYLPLKKATILGDGNFAHTKEHFLRWYKNQKI